MGELVDCALRIAADDVAHGLHEIGANNGGPDVEWIRQHDGTGRGIGGRGSWCASYLSSVWMRASAQTRILLPFATSRGARALWRNVGGAGAFADEPVAGAIVCWARGATGWQGHVELVTRCDLTTSGIQFWTIGGNRGRFPAAVEEHGPYLLRAERERRLLGFSCIRG